MYYLFSSCVILVLLCCFSGISSVPCANVASYINLSESLIASNCSINVNDSNLILENSMIECGSSSACSGYITIYNTTVASGNVIATVRYVCPPLYRYPIPCCSKSGSICLTDGVPISSSSTPSITPSMSNTVTPSVTSSVTMTPSSSTTPSTSITPSSSVTVSVTSSPTASVTETPSSSTTPSISITPSSSITVTSSSSTTPSISITPSVTSSPTASPGFSRPILVSFAGGSFFDNYNSDANTLGWEFSTSVSCSVTHLGYWNGEGTPIVYSHKVGLWNTNGTLLGAVTVTPTSPLTNNFRYEPLTVAVPISLGNYVLGAFTPANNPNTDGYYLSTASQVLSTGFSIISSRREAGDTYPDITGAGNGRFGPNAICF